MKLLLENWNCFLNEARNAGNWLKYYNILQSHKNDYGHIKDEHLPLYFYVAKTGRVKVEQRPRGRAPPENPLSELQGRRVRISNFDPWWENHITPSNLTLNGQEGTIIRVGFWRNRGIQVSLDIKWDDPQVGKVRYDSDPGTTVFLNSLTLNDIIQRRFHMWIELL